MKNKIIAFDLDNTLCQPIKSNHENKLVPKQLLKLQPYKKHIKVLCDMKKEGNKIIIFTSRYGPDEIKDATRKWLKKHRVPYDEIIWNKPSYDMLIDDKAISAYQGGLSSTLINTFIDFNENKIAKEKAKQ